MSPAFDGFSNPELYSPALFALRLLCAAVLIQNFLTAPLAFLKEE